MRLAGLFNVDKKLLKELELEVAGWVVSLLFGEILETTEGLKKREIVNSNNEIDLILEALKNGKIALKGETLVLQGKNNWGANLLKQLKKLGAVKSKTGYRLPKITTSSAVASIKQAVVYQEALVNKKLEQIKNVQDGIVKKVSLAKFHSNIFPLIVDDIVSKSINSFGKYGIGIKKTITPEVKKELIKTYVTRIETYSKHLAVAENVKLREKLIKQVATKNLTPDSLSAVIAKRFGITARHARFIARQETGMAREKIQQANAQRLGFNRYVWQTVGDSRVRPTIGESPYNDHRVLNGRIFSFDSPPVVDTLSGRRCNPREDFGCRCTARVIIEE